MLEQEQDNQRRRWVPERVCSSHDLLGSEEEISSCRFMVPNKKLNVLRKKIFSALLMNIEEETGPLFGHKFDIFPDEKWRQLFAFLRGTGLAKDIIPNRTFNDEISLADIHIVANIENIQTDGHKPNIGFNRGTSFVYEEALSKAFGEFFERYGLLTYKQRDLVRASTHDLANQNHIDPASVASFSEKKRKSEPLLQFDKNSIFYWAKGHSLLNGREVLIPAQLIFWNYCTHHKNILEPYIRETNTNGAGGGFTREEALLSGLYEVVQRDGLLLYWYNKLAPPVIDNDTIVDEAVQKMIYTAEQKQFEVVFLDTTTELRVPSVTCILIDKSGHGPKLAMGAGCSFDPNGTLSRSFVEACSIYNWLRRRPFSVQLEKDYEPFSNKYLGQAERSKIWANGSMFGEFSFFINGEKRPYDSFIKNGLDFTNNRNELDTLVKRVSGQGPGYEPVFFEAENDILNAVGYHSVKVVVPQLIPLHLNEWNAATGAERISEGCKKLGLPLPTNLNTLPHPFP